MSYQNERCLVLEMLNAGNINTEQAEILLSAMNGQTNRRVLRQTRCTPNTVLLEIQADEENLRAILEKFNEALEQVNLH